MMALEKDIDRVWTTFAAHVKKDHFDAVIAIIQSNQAEIQRDIKEILAVVSKLDGSR